MQENPMQEYPIIDHVGKEISRRSSARNKVRMPPTSPEEEQKALRKISKLGKAIVELEEEIVIMSEAIASDEEEPQDQKKARVKKPALKKPIKGFEDNPFINIKPVSHEEILDLVPVLADMISRLKRLKIEEQSLVAKLPSDVQIAHQASGETQSKLRAGKNNLPPWISEAVEPVSIDKAESIMGLNNTFGAKRVAQAFHMKESELPVPPIPFTLLELKEAKERGDRLVLRVDQAPDVDGQVKPLTLERIVQLPLGEEDGETIVFMNNKRVITEKNDIDKDSIFQMNLKEKELLEESPFFNSETPRAGWFLVNKQHEPSKEAFDDLLEQTRGLRDELANFASPEELAECSPEQLDDIARWKEKDLHKMNAILANLKINKNYRRRAVEVAYDAIVFQQNIYDKNGNYILSEESVEDTLSADAEGNFVRIDFVPRVIYPKEEFYDHYIDLGKKTREHLEAFKCVITTHPYSYNKYAVNRGRGN